LGCATSKSILRLEFLLAQLTKAHSLSKALIGSPSYGRCAYLGQTPPTIYVVSWENSSLCFFVAVNQGHKNKIDSPSCPPYQRRCNAKIKWYRLPICKSCFRSLIKVGNHQKQESNRGIVIRSTHTRRNCKCVWETHGEAGVQVRLCGNLEAQDRSSRRLGKFPREPSHQSRRSCR
jgi:hypothetical protein